MRKMRTEGPPLRRRHRLRLGRTRPRPGRGSRGGHALFSSTHSLRAAAEVAAAHINRIVHEWRAKNTEHLAPRAVRAFRRISCELTAAAAAAQ